MIINALKRSDGNINYPGLIAAWSAKGKTNDDADRATLKDLTGNGHDITLNRFAFSEMSGYGGYNWNFNNFSRNFWKHTDSKIILDFSNTPSTNSNVFENSYIPETLINGTKVKVSGIKNNSTLTLYSQLNTKDTSLYPIIGNYINIKQDGIYELPDIIIPDEYNSYLSVSYYGFRNIKINEGDRLIVEQIPKYPDALLFDGVDDYGINNDMPILTDYTIIAKRRRINFEKTETFISKIILNISGEFIFEVGSSVINAYSFGQYTEVPYCNNDTVYQTKRNYNGNTIRVGGSLGGKNLCIGRRVTGNDFYTGAFYSAYLFDRSLDEQEIKSFIRKYIDPEYLLPSEIPTPDCYYDLSKGSNDDETRDTIKDLSGNGNDAVAHNFGWNENSGYGGCANFVQWINVRNNYIGSITLNKIYISESKTDQKPILYSPYIRNLMKFKVEGLLQNQSIRFGSDINNSTLLEVTQDGIYEVDWNKSTSTRCIIPTFIGECDITIELLPEYPGALVFDGVDDYVSLDAFDSGFKTMFMVCNPRNKHNVFLYDQRKNAEPPYDYGLYTYNSVAYNMRNVNGTYINGIKNTKVFTKDLNNKKILINVNSKLTQLNKPTIGIGITGSYSDMALYKFLGFKEALTEEQIQAVIKKYNLLDGVDKIEVS